MKYILFLSVVLLCVSCDTRMENKQDVQSMNFDEVNSEKIKKIQIALSKFDYKTNVYSSFDTLKIDVFVESEDYFSPYFMKLTKELMLVSIFDVISQTDKIMVTEVLSNGVRNKTPDIVDYKIVKELVDYNSQYNTTYDFKKYIFKNIRREKLMRLNAIIDELLIDRPSVPLKEKDFILVVMNYADDCMGLRKDEFYTKLLKAIKEVASDKSIWSDFNSQDIDYFLNYCNKNNSKEV